MRSAKEEGFNFNEGRNCYFEIDKNGKPTQIPHKRKCDRPELLKAYARAKAGETKIYGVWVGNWSSDLFIIDDLEAFYNAFQ